MSGTFSFAPGQKDVKTAMIYTHVLNRGGKGGEKPDGWIINTADPQGVSLTDHAV